MFATWLEDGAVPARVIDELMGHQAGRRGEREGSMIGTRYRHMTEAMQARVVAVIAERLTVALAAMPQVCPKPESEGGGVLRPDATRRLTCDSVVVELRGFEPLTPCMPCHPHQLTRPSAAPLRTASALLRQVARQGAVL
jgi:hypothetical protein